MKTCSKWNSFFCRCTLLPRPWEFSCTFLRRLYSIELLCIFLRRLYSIELPLSTRILLRWWTELPCSSTCIFLWRWWIELPCSSPSNAATIPTTSRIVTDQMEFFFRVISLRLYGLVGFSNGNERRNSSFAMSFIIVDAQIFMTLVAVWYLCLVCLELFTWYPLGSMGVEYFRIITAKVRKETFR